MKIRALIGTRKGLFLLDDSSGELAIRAQHFAGAPVTRTLQDPRDGAIYAALDHGHFGVKLHRSDDDGQSFPEIHSPVYPPKPEGLVDLDPMRNEERPWTTQVIWALTPGHASQPGRLYCGTMPGGLFTSDDRGASWSLNEALWNIPERAQWMGGGNDNAVIDSVTVRADDPDEILIAVSTGGVWRTTDGGRSWSVGTGMRNGYMPPGQEYDPVAQDAHRVVRAPSAPDVLWCQHHNGIFRSTDSGATWNEFTDVQPSTFGFAVAVHPHDPDTAWFVPAAADMDRTAAGGAVAVTRTRDGGATWEALRAGLPQTNAYHLVLRHALDVDSTGERLVFGSTTGSLWSSGDGGDSWTRISSDLPPIYSVEVVG